MGIIDFIIKKIVDDATQTRRLRPRPQIPPRILQGTITAPQQTLLPRSAGLLGSARKPRQSEPHGHQLDQLAGEVCRGELEDVQLQIV